MAIHVEEKEKEIVNVAPAKTCSSIAAGRKLTAKDMSLKFVASILHSGKCFAKIDKSEVKQLSDVWANAIVLYVVSQTPSIGAIIRYITMEWNHVGKPKAYMKMVIS